MEITFVKVGIERIHQRRKELLFNFRIGCVSLENVAGYVGLEIEKGFFSILEHSFEVFLYGDKTKESISKMEKSINRARGIVTKLVKTRGVDKDTQKDILDLYKTSFLPIKRLLKWSVLSDE